MALEKWTVRPINNAIANMFAIHFHYLGTSVTGIKHSFGLYAPDNRMVGICIFGNPVSAKASLPAFGKEKVKLLELRRMWVTDDTPKNAESFLIANAVKMLPRDIKALCSYADPALHEGRIYLACNFTFLGKGGENVTLTLYGKHQTKAILKHVKLSEMRKMFGKDLEVKINPGKLRYFMVIAKSKARHKYLSALLSAASEAVK